MKTGVFHKKCYPKFSDICMNNGTQFLSAKRGIINRNLTRVQYAEPSHCNKKSEYILRYLYMYLYFLINWPPFVTKLVLRYISHTPIYILLININVGIPVLINFYLHFYGSIKIKLSYNTGTFIQIVYYLNRKDTCYSWAQSFAPEDRYHSNHCKEKKARRDAYIEWLFVKAALYGWRLFHQ